MFGGYLQQNPPDLSSSHYHNGLTFDSNEVLCKLTYGRATSCADTGSSGDGPAAGYEQAS